MKALLIICLAFCMSNAGAAQKSHGGHAAAQQSLLAECQSANALPSPHCGRVPTAKFADNGDLYVVFSQHGHIYLTSSSDQGKSFRTPVVVNRNPELIYDDGENRPKLALGKNAEIYISWTHKTPGRYSGDVRFARSLDGGKTFDDPLTVNSDRAIISHRFDSMTLDHQGRIFLIWIDKRDSDQARKSEQEYAGASLYYALSDNSGASFLPNRKLVDHSCECCRIATDIDSAGSVVALWRHVYPVNIRDHAITRITAQQPSIQGLPVRASDDGWKIDGCPHHGPDLSMDDKDRAHMAWFTQGEKNKGLMYGRFDFNHQQTELVSSIDSSPSASRPQVQVIGSRVYLLWKRFNGQQMDLLMSRSMDEGQSWSAPESLATTEHGSDHPDWLRFGDRLYAAWHTQSEGLTLIPVPR